MESFFLEFLAVLSKEGSARREVVADLAPKYTQAAGDAERPLPRSSHSGPDRR